MGSSAKGGGYSQASPPSSSFAGKFQQWMNQAGPKYEGGGEAAATGRQSAGTTPRDQVGPVERALFDFFTNDALNDDKKTMEREQTPDPGKPSIHRSKSKVPGSLLDDDNDTTDEGGFDGMGFGDRSSERGGMGGV